MESLIFYFLAAIVIGFAILVVTLPHILHSAIALIVSFFGTAALYIFLQSEFIAIAQILVYIGGIVIFMLFAILLTTRMGEKFLLSSLYKKIVALIVVFLVFVSLLYIYFNSPGQFAGVELAPVAKGSIAEIGSRLMSTDKTGFIIPFEVISILLLASMVGAIVIARKSEKE